MRFKFVVAIAGLVGCLLISQGLAQSPASIETNSTANGSEGALLTTEQQQQILQINQELGIQIRGILTPEQMAELQTKLGNGEQSQQVLSTLNLTSSQETALGEAFSNARQQLESVLAPEQIQELFMRSR